MKPNSMENLKKLHRHVKAKDVPMLLGSLQEIGLDTKITRNLFRTHTRYKETLKIQMSSVPHSVETRVKEMDLVDGVKTIRNSIHGLELREALWFYNYFTKGIIPWFMDGIGG